MGVNFPNSPTTNQVFQGFTWDGEKWVLTNTGLIYVSDTPPAGALANSLWWESDTGQLYIRFNDGDSTQWVTATPTPNIASYVVKSGDTMSGVLNVPAGATGTQVPRVQEVVKKTGDTMSGDLTPATNAGANLGSASLRWATIYTSDLSLKNDKGDWTIVEGEDDLFITNNKTGKKYKFVLTEV